MVKVEHEFRSASVVRQIFNPRKNVSTIILIRENYIKKIYNIRAAARTIKVRASLLITHCNEWGIVPAAIYAKNLAAVAFLTDLTALWKRGRFLQYFHKV